MISLGTKENKTHQVDVMKRRDFLKKAGMGSTAASLPFFLSWACRSAGNVDSRPNILFIMSDDHAAPSISAYGGFLSGLVKTPHIDRLAKEGMRFNNCFCTNSICTPSRASILTGKYSHKNGVLTLDDNFDRSQQTFPRHLQKAGYYTRVVGKWHLKTEPAGFDYFKVLPGQGKYFNPILNEKGNPWPASAEGGRVHPGYVTDVITDLALEFLANRPGGNPFCLLYHHKAPHDMWEYDQKHEHLYEEVDIPEPANLFDDYRNRGEAIKRATQKIGMEETLFLHKTQGNQFSDVRAEIGKWDPVERKRKAYQYFIKAYLRCVASLDENVGRVLNYLDESGLAGNTIVIYTSDQGVFLGEHGLFDKRFMYEESIRMPFLVRYPKEIKAGSVNNDIVLNIDFAETMLDYAGISIPKDMQGRSLKSLFRGETPIDWRQCMYYRYWMHGAHFNVAAHFGIRTPKHKLIYYYGLPLEAKGAQPEPTPPEWELFDLGKDPAEMNNVFDDPAYAETRRKLTEQLFELQKQYEDTDPTFANRFGVFA